MTTFFHINKDTDDNDFDCFESTGIGHKDNNPPDEESFRIN